MDRCEKLSKMQWTESISMRQYEQMSRERGFAESITAFVLFKLIILFSVHHKSNDQCDTFCQ